jgi:hypothetical protein
MFILCRVAKNEPRKHAKGLRPLETAPLPLCKERLGEKHKSFECIARRKVNTSGRRGKVKSFSRIGRGK